MVRPVWRCIKSKTISLEFRQRVASMVDAGSSARAAAHYYGVGESFAIKLIARLKATGDTRPAQQGWPPGIGNWYLSGLSFGYCLEGA